MKRLLGPAVCAISLNMAGAVFAAPYYLGSIVEGQLAFVDLSSIEQTGSTVTVTIARIYRDHQDLSGTDGYQYILYKSEYDCGSGGGRFLEARAMSRDHILVHTLRSGPTKWTVAEPGTGGTTLREAVCSPASRNPELVIDLETTDLVDRALQTGFD
jgi:hypothetical protein